MREKSANVNVKIQMQNIPEFRRRRFEIVVVVLVYKNKISIDKYIRKSKEKISKRYTRKQPRIYNQCLQGKPPLQLWLIMECKEQAGSGRYIREVGWKNCVKNI